MPHPETTLTMAEASAVVGRPRSFLERQIEIGNLQAHRAEGGRRILVSALSLQALVDSGRHIRRRRGPRGSHLKLVWVNPHLK